jgi:hypothetical protein
MQLCFATEMLGSATPLMRQQSLKPCNAHVMLVAGSVKASSCSGPPLKRRPSTPGALAVAPALTALTAKKLKPIM